MCFNECERVLLIWRAFLLVSTHSYPNLQLHWVGTLVFVASIILFRKGVRKTFLKQSHGFAFKGPKKSEKEVVEVGKHRIKMSSHMTIQRMHSKHMLSLQGITQGHAHARTVGTSPRHFHLKPQLIWHYLHIHSIRQHRKRLGKQPF